MGDSYYDYDLRQNEPPLGAFPRFVRGYFGALPALIVPLLLAFILGYAEQLDELAFSPEGVGLLLIPALIAWRAMQVMPAGDEAAYLRSRIMPLIGEGIRGAVAVLILLAVWGFAAFVFVGGVGMVWTAFRRLFF